MDGVAWAASAMIAARTRLEIATENLANVSTAGFRGVQARGFLSALGVQISRRPALEHGALRETGRALDLAILGDGTFAVADAAGNVAHTRDGAFIRHVDGTLHDSAGRTLLGRSGVLRIPDGARIDERGRVFAAGRLVDQLTLAPSARVRSGFLECAGVDAIDQMIDVLASERSFESAEKAVAAIDNTRQKSAEAARVK